MSAEPEMPEAAPGSLDQQVCTALVERRVARFMARNREPYARNNPIASDLGDCERAMSLAILAWNVRPPLPAGALERMEAGNEQERSVLRQLVDEGWDVVEQQAPIEIRGRDGRTVILRGKIDGKLLWRTEPGARPTLILLEIKDTSFPNFQRWRSEDDLRMDRWARKWWRQIQAYLLALGLEWGLLLLTHRGERRPIVIRLDYGAAELILQRAERAVEIRGALQGDPLDSLDGSLNALGLPYLGDARGCASCDFHRRVCFPPQLGGAGHLGDLLLLPDEVGELVGRERALADAAREHASLARRLERLIPRGTHARAGDWFVTGSWEEQNTKPVEAQPAKPAGTRKVWHRVTLSADTLTRPNALAETPEDGGAQAL